MTPGRHRYPSLFQINTRVWLHVFQKNVVDK